MEAYIRNAAYRELDRETMEMLKRPWIMSEEGRKGFVRQMVQANSRSTEDVEGRYHEVEKKMPVRVIRNLGKRGQVDSHGGSEEVEGEAGCQGRGGD